jgi:hypothetical protein
MSLQRRGGYGTRNKSPWSGPGCQRISLQPLLRVWEQESLERSWVPVDKSAAAAEGRVWAQESLEPPDTHARAADGSKCMVETAVNSSLSHGARREDGGSWGGECVCGPQCGR